MPCRWCTFIPSEDPSLDTFWGPAEHLNCSHHMRPTAAHTHSLFTAHPCPSPLVLRPLRSRNPFPPGAFLRVIPQCGMSLTSPLVVSEAVPSSPIAPSKPWQFLLQALLWPHTVSQFWWSWFNIRLSEWPAGPKGQWLVSARTLWLAEWVIQEGPWLTFAE